MLSVVDLSRYGEQLKLARNEGFKKALFSNLVVGGLYFVMFSTYALSLWLVLLFNKLQLNVNPMIVFQVWGYPNFGL